MNMLNYQPNIVKRFFILMSVTNKLSGVVARKLSGFVVSFFLGGTMRQTELLQEVRNMRFEDIYEIWTEKRLTQEDAARMLGVCSRTFRRYIDRYEEYGLEGLKDKRLEQVSSHRAPVDEVFALTERYKSLHMGWNVKHFHSWYKKNAGKRSYTWVK